MSNRKLVPIHNDWSSGGKGCQALLVYSVYCYSYHSHIVCVGS